MLDTQTSTDMHSVGFTLTVIYDSLLKHIEITVIIHALRQLESSKSLG